MVGMDNAQLFLNACQEMGVRESDLFLPMDLVGQHFSIKKVVNCVVALRAALGVADAMEDFFGSMLTALPTDQLAAIASGRLLLLLLCLFSVVVAIGCCGCRGCLWLLCCCVVVAGDCDTTDLLEPLSLARFHCVSLLC